MYSSVVVSSTRPGSAALFGSISPEPLSKALASVTPSSFSTSGLALVISDDFSSAGVNSGWSCVSSAAAPATCGEAIEVPLIDWNSSPGFSSELTAGSGAAAARMFTPGAVTSGFGMSGTAVCGPRDENAARMPPRGRPVALPAVSSAVVPPGRSAPSRACRR